MRERSKQVSRMSQIYSRAARVNIWLGPESHDSILAIKTIVDLSKTVYLDLETQTFKPLNDPGNWCNLHTVLPYTDDQINAICNLLHRPWFERLWVWQEIRLGNPNSLIMVGHESMLWRQFYVAGFFLRWKREFGLRHRYLEMEPMIEVVNGMMNNITQSPMATLSLRTCFSKCSEPRDRVYALMGITTDEVELRPDYALSIGEVYRDVALQHLHQLGNLELLSSCTKRVDSGELPTWAPDWRIPNQRKRWFDLVGAGEPPARARYIEPNILEVAGVAVDTIVQVISLPQVGTNEEILAELRRVASQFHKDTASGHGFRLDAYCRTLFANEFTERYKPAGELLNFQNYTTALNVLVENDDAARVAHFIKDYKIQTADRALAVTSTGYLALVPTEALRDDEIAHILGSRWPFVVRPRDNSANEYTIVGFAYVDGDNDREALLGPYPTDYSGVALYDAPSGKWWPMAYHQPTGSSHIEDPRLGPLPEGWTIREHEEQHLWNWYEKPGSEGEEFVAERKEHRLRSDPRLMVESLQSRGIDVKMFRLV